MPRPLRAVRIQRHVGRSVRPAGDLPMRRRHYCLDYFGELPVLTCVRVYSGLTLIVICGLGWFLVAVGFEPGCAPPDWVSRPREPGSATPDAITTKASVAMNAVTLQMICCTDASSHAYGYRVRTIILAPPERKHERRVARQLSSIRCAENWRGPDGVFSRPRLFEIARPHAGA